MEYDGSYIGQLRTDDCIEYPPRIARYLRAQRIVTKVHREACWLGFKTGIAVSAWVVGLVAFACWLAWQ